MENPATATVFNTEWPILNWGLRWVTAERRWKCS